MAEELNFFSLCRSFITVEQTDTNQRFDTHKHTYHVLRLYLYARFTLPSIYLLEVIKSLLLK
jgi:hypothetical protein